MRSTQCSRCFCFLGIISSSITVSTLLINISDIFQLECSENKTKYHVLDAIDFTICHGIQFKNIKNIFYIMLK